MSNSAYVQLAKLGSAKRLKDLRVLVQDFSPSIVKLDWDEEASIRKEDFDKRVVCIKSSLGFITPAREKEAIDSLGNLLGLIHITKEAKENGGDFSYYFSRANSYIDNLMDIRRISVEGTTLAKKPGKGNLLAKLENIVGSPNIEVMAVWATLALADLLWAVAMDCVGHSK